MIRRLKGLFIIPVFPHSDHHGHVNNGHVYGNFEVVRYKVDNGVSDSIRQVVDIHALRLERQSDFNTNVRRAQMVRDQRDQFARQRQAHITEQQRHDQHRLQQRQENIRRQQLEMEQRERRFQQEAVRQHNMMRQEVRRLARGQAVAMHQLSSRQNQMMQSERRLEQNVRSWAHRR